MSFLNYREKRKRKHYSSPQIYKSFYRRKRGHRYRKRKRDGEKRWPKAVGIAAAVFALCAALGCGGVYMLYSTGRSGLQKQAQENLADAGATDEDGTLISKDGKTYAYKENLINILCLGVDRDTELGEDEGVTSGSGQTDTIFIVSIDTDTNEMNLIALSRDTMTEVDTYDYQGNYVGESVNHLGLAFAFGDGREGSCELTVKAVSKLFYDLPIHGYVAVNMNAISEINDSVGGVVVTLDEDMTLAGEEMSAGTSVRLDGEQALAYVRSRDTEEEGSNNKRMERQKKYVIAFLAQARTALKKNITLAASLYQSLQEDMVTSVDLSEAVYLASLLPSISFGEENITAVQGTTQQGSVYEEFYVDEDALLDLLFDKFYDEVVK